MEEAWITLPWSGVIAYLRTPLTQLIGLAGNLLNQTLEDIANT